MEEKNEHQQASGEGKKEADFDGAEAVGGDAHEPGEQSTADI